MNNNLLKQISLLFLICVLVLVIFTKGNQTINATELINQSVLKENQNFLLPIQEKNNATETQGSVDRTINILNVVATLMGVLVAILTLILAILGGLGFLQISKWKEIRKNVEEDVNAIKNLREKAEKDLNEMRERIGIPSLDKEPTPEIKEKLDQFSHRLETIEMLGISLKPGDYLNQGTDFYYKGKYDEALKAFNKAIELDSKNAKAWLSKGAAFGLLKRYDEALETFNKAIELDSKNARVWSGKGAAFVGLERYDEALKIFDKAIELDPKDTAGAWSGKGIALVGLERYDEALKIFDKAIELNPKNAEAWYSKACTYSLMRNKEKALEYLSKAIKLDIEYKKEAKKDKDFKDFWDDEDFKNIVK